jgi:pyruvate formate lyase activating enzyme
VKLDACASRPARHWQPITSDRVECRLCPRHCQPRDGEWGYCGVRGARGGELHTYNFGLSLTPTEECIETEAVVHFSPGSRILSLGNIGCMMSCVFCQNWQTSQIEHLDAAQIRHCTPRELVDICLKNGIKIISWTYNDPVVWHEFVLETSALAREHGLKTLYKSAFSIEEAPVEELIDCIDIFSLSLKSVSEAFYRNATKAELKPVLSRIAQVARSNRHLEISYLMIPGLNDGQDDIRNMITWVLNQVGDEVPLHLVAFHPAYQYTTVGRTKLSALIEARAVARAMGVRHVYLGNTLQTGSNDTVCARCGAILVQRYGLHAQPRQIDAGGCCTRCGTLSPITAALDGVQLLLPGDGADLKRRLEFLWHSEAQSVHVVRTAGSTAQDRIRLRPLGPHPATERTLSGGLDRFIVARQSDDDRGIVISWDSDNRYQIAPLLDRAHFPVAPFSDQSRETA